PEAHRSQCPLLRTLQSARPPHSRDDTTPGLPSSKRSLRFVGNYPTVWETTLLPQSEQATKSVIPMSFPSCREPSISVWTLQAAPRQRPQRPHSEPVTFSGAEPNCFRRRGKAFRITSSPRTRNGKAVVMRLGASGRSIGERLGPVD